MPYPPTLPRLGVGSWFNNLTSPPGTAPGVPGTRAAWPDPVAQAWEARNQKLAATQAYDTAQQGIYAPAMAANTASRGVLDATAGTFPLRAAYNTAQRGVLGAQGQELAGTRAYIGQEQGFNQTQQGQTRALEAARNNAPDIMAVGQANRYNAANDAQLRQWGIAPPENVTLPDNYTGPMAPGTRAAPQTQEQALTRANEYPNRVSELQLRGAQLAVSLLGTNTQAAEQAARAAGLSLEDAQLMVSEAQNQAGYASNTLQGELYNKRYGPEAQNLREAGYAEQAAALPPFPGAVSYTNPDGSGQWVTPGQQQDLSYADAQARTRARIPDTYATSQASQQYRTQAEGQGSQFAALPTAALLNTIPSGGGPLYTQPIIEELTRRLVLQGYPPTEAQAAAMELVRQELATRRRTGSTSVFGAPSTSSAPSTPTQSNNTGSFAFTP